MVNLPLFTGFSLCQVVQDFFHKQYQAFAVASFSQPFRYETCQGWEDLLMYLLGPGIFLDIMWVFPEIVVHQIGWL